MTWKTCKLRNFLWNPTLWGTGIGFYYQCLVVIDKNCSSFSWNSFQTIETMIPQSEGFHLQKSCKDRNFYILQSEEEDSFSSNSSDCRINELCKPIKWGVSLITSNMRKLGLVFILRSDSSDSSILCHKKHANWGTFFEILQSEELESAFIINAL